MNILDDMVEQATPWQPDADYLCRWGAGSVAFVTPAFGIVFPAVGQKFYRSRLPLSQYVAGDKVKAEADAEMAKDCDALKWGVEAWSSNCRDAQAARDVLKAKLAAMTAERDQFKQRLDAFRCALDGASNHIRKLSGQRDALSAELAALRSALSGTEVGELTATEINGQEMKAKSSPAPAADDGEWEEVEITNEEYGKLALHGRHIRAQFDYADGRSLGWHGEAPDRGTYFKRVQRVSPDPVTLQSLAARVAALESRAKGGAS